MAILPDDSMFHGLSGRSGEVIFYQRYGKTIIAAAPIYHHLPTDSQVNQRDLFAETVLFAKNMLADPERKKEYTAKARKMKKCNAFQAAIAEFMLLQKR